MDTTGSVLGAQYLRMSTERQQFSMQNHADQVQRYAEDHGFIITRTYSNAAKSGLVLRNAASKTS